MITRDIAQELIQSAATFSKDFVKQLEWFQTLRLKRVATGAVLYSGEQRFNIRDIRILNPLYVKDIWDTLTAPSENTAP